MSDKTVKKNRAASVQGSLYFQDRGGFNRVEKKKKKKKKNRSTFPEDRREFLQLDFSSSVDARLCSSPRGIVTKSNEFESVETANEIICRRG